MKASVVKNFRRPDPSWVEKFKTIPTTIITDCLQRRYGMSGEMRPLYDGIRFCGPALTIQSMAGNNLMSHLALTFARAGDVLVIDAGGYLGNAVWGGVQAVYARKKGIAGLVVDGAVRDAEEMRQMKFPVFCKGITPNGPHKGWADNVNGPIQCAGVPVHPGDLVVADDDGVAVVPLSKLPAVYEESLERMTKERSWLEKIGRGESSLDAVGLRETLDHFDIEYRDE